MKLVSVTGDSFSFGTCIDALEQGDILLFPQTPFPISVEDREALLAVGQADGNFHKNIAYRPATGKLTGLGAAKPGEAERVRAALASYSRNAIELFRNLARAYSESWKIDFASFRSIEEEGRVLPVKKRNDLLHTDAFPTRPTNGGLILRIFSNIHPIKSRDWVTSQPFAELAPKLAADAGLERIVRNTGRNAGKMRRKLITLGRRLGLPVIDRSPYDQFMLDFHDYLKLNSAYQQDSVKFRFCFPPGSTWAVFTDIVPHAVLAGRYALEQTLIIDRRSLRDHGRAPASILERMAGRKLTYPL